MGDQGLVRDQRGSVAVEGAIAISILVGVLAALMAIVQESYAEDRMGRAARAAARAVALNAQADPCAAIRRELSLASDYDCEGEWQITIDFDVSPSGLSTLVAGETQEESSNGELVLVRIGWKEDAQESDTEVDSEGGVGNVETASEGGDADSTDPADETEPDDTDSNVEPVPMVAMGVARSEPKGH